LKIKEPHMDRGKGGRPVKILLIQPPTLGGVRPVEPQLDDDSGGIGFKPPIGILYLATTAKEWGGHEVKIIDAVAQQLDFPAIVKQALDYRPQLIGISAWTDFWWPAQRLGKLLKEALPQTHLCYGGPHVCIFPEETLNFPFIDSIVLGDGEIPLLSLANMLGGGVINEKIPGLHFKMTGVKSGEQTYFIQRDLDSLPIPDRRLLDLELYSSILGKAEKVTTMITSRGCPGKCVFCKLSFQKTLCRSAANVLEEFQQIQNLGIKEVEVYDDTFTWSKKRVAEICQGLIASGNPLKWAIRDRVDRADPQLLQLLRQAGCTRVHYGIESGVDRVLKRMRKGISTNQAKQAVAWAKAAGLEVLTYFMLGNFDETLDDMQRTIAFAMELDTDYTQFSITIPYPGTELYKEALQTSLISRDYWREQALQPTPNFQIPQVIESHASLETLINLRDQGIKSFYFRPEYLWRQIKKVDNLPEFVKKARMGLHLFKKVILG